MLCEFQMRDNGRETKPVTIRMEQVICLYPEGNRCALCLSNGARIVVTKDYEHVKAFLRQHSPFRKL